MSMLKSFGQVLQSGTFTRHEHPKDKHSSLFYPHGRSVTKIVFQHWHEKKFEIFNDIFSSSL